MSKFDSVTIEPSDKKINPMALGCWSFGGAQWAGQEDKDSMDAMAKSLEMGITHFDTARGYGRGRSEEVVGRFIKDKRDKIFLATKNAAVPEKAKYKEAIENSLRTINTDYIDLYYIHWPKKDIDLRPTMEALEEAREAGKIRSVGVSNFSIDQMKQIMEVGTINAHQLCYNLYWRFDEDDIIPFCQKNSIAVVTYSSIAQGILTGKFPRHPEFKEGDHRSGTVLFDEKVWPYVYEGTEKLKELSREKDIPMTHMAIQWAAVQEGIHSIIVGARNKEQAERNFKAAETEIPKEVFTRMTEISNKVIKHVPDTGNIFRFYP
jgi:aryl-alcohol dehydrogenase-like predicted oxidoreductase